MDWLFISSSLEVMIAGVVVVKVELLCVVMKLLFEVLLLMIIDIEGWHVAIIVAKITSIVSVVISQFLLRLSLL